MILITFSWQTLSSIVSDSGHNFLICSATGPAAVSRFDGTSVSAACPATTHNGQNEFLRISEPSSKGEDFLSASLSVAFAKYEVQQMLWYIDQFTSSAGREIRELEQQYARNHVEPWDLVNRVLTTMYERGGEDLAFNFAVAEGRALTFRFTRSDAPTALSDPLRSLPQTLYVCSGFKEWMV